MKKVYHLLSCSTCQRIIKDLQLKEKGFVLQDIKAEKISPSQLDKMVEMSGSVEPLFSTKAIRYRELGLKDKKLTDKEMKNYILNEYTFLKRPVIIINSGIYIGSSPSVLSRLKALL
ncbi:MAG TPA: ArsC/Spx/MgsR family protein [Bacteroidia bacterium]|jgi:arsenate reductase|nr:ArsC/Spx/MgsR family protein [Bacteroidia bacterium]